MHFVVYLYLSWVGIHRLYVAYPEFQIIPFQRHWPLVHSHDLHTNLGLHQPQDKPSMFILFQQMAYYFYSVLIFSQTQMTLSWVIGTWEWGLGWIHQNWIADKYRFYTTEVYVWAQGCSGCQSRVACVCLSHEPEMSHTHKHTWGERHRERKFNKLIHTVKQSTK